MNIINEVTYTKLQKEYYDYCADKIKEFKKNNKYISSANFKSDITKKYNEILANNKDKITEEQYNNLKKYFEEYTATIIKNYEKVLIKEEKEIEERRKEKMDKDPVVSNSHTYYNGRINTPFSGYAGTNSTYSMADMVCTINIDTEYGPISATLGELQTISYSIYQNKTPVRVLGNMNPKSWVFGSRTIAGSLVFAVFNKHWIMDLYDNLKEKAGMKNWHFITDEIPPFDITLTFANEYGFDSRMAIYGVHIMNEGQTMSTNDIYIENTYQFVATDIELMDSLRSYQEGNKRHIRGLGVINNEKTEEKQPEKKEPNPIDKDKEQKEEKPEDKFNEAMMYIDTATLDRMKERDALKHISEVYKKWRKEAKTEAEKNFIKEVYKREKKRIKEYYDKKDENK